MDVISFANLITIRDGVQLMNFDYHRKHRFMINFHFALVDNTKDSVAAACSNRGGDITRYRRRSAPANFKRCNKKNVKMCYTTTSAMNLFASLPCHSQGHHLRIYHGEVSLKEGRRALGIG